MDTLPKFSPLLRLDKTMGDLDKIRRSFSAIALHERNLWVGGDEGTLIHRLTRDAAGNFGQHRQFDLAPILDLPVQGEKSEIDVEGLDVDSGQLWLVGSHSVKREKAKNGKPVSENLNRLAKVEADGNRFTLGRVPMIPSGGDFEIAASGARLEGDDRGNLLTEALAGDAHIGPFVPRIGDKASGIPSKDNGLDVEGLAVSGSRIFIGLRGPVLRGWAVMLEIEVKDESAGHLGLAKLGGSKEHYRKHFLQLEGLGIRELAIDGDSILILAGPTMELDGPVYVFRWPKALTQTSDSVVWRDELEKVLTVPFGVGNDRGLDHPEGIALDESEEKTRRVMICYDSPPSSRLDGEDGVRADVFEFGLTGDTDS